MYNLLSVLWVPLVLLHWKVIQTIVLQNSLIVALKAHISEKKVNQCPECPKSFQGTGPCSKSWQTHGSSSRSMPNGSWYRKVTNGYVIWVNSFIIDIDANNNVFYFCKVETDVSLKSQICKEKGSNRLLNGIGVGVLFSTSLTLRNITRRIHDQAWRMNPSKNLVLPVGSWRLGVWGLGHRFPFLARATGKPEFLYGFGVQVLCGFFPHVLRVRGAQWHWPKHQLIAARTVNRRALPQMSRSSMQVHPMSLGATQCLHTLQGRLGQHWATGNTSLNCSLLLLLLWPSSGSALLNSHPPGQTKTLIGFNHVFF